MTRRRLFLLASVGLMVAATFSGHLLVRALAERGHVDRFVIEESHIHAESSGSFFGPEMWSALVIGSAGLALGSRSKRALPAIAAVAPLLAVGVQEGAEHGLGSFAASFNSESFVVFLAVLVVTGVLLAVLSRWLVHAVMLAARWIRSHVSGWRTLLPLGDGWWDWLGCVECASRSPPFPLNAWAARAPPLPARS